MTVTVDSVCVCVCVCVCVSQDIIDWYLVIRQSKINILKEKYGEMEDEVVNNSVW